MTSLSRVLVVAFVVGLVSGSAEGARLSMNGSGTGGTIVRDGTGDASNVDGSASGDTDTLAALGFTDLTLASDLGGLTLLVSASNPDDPNFPQFPELDSAVVSTLRVFFTTDTPCQVGSPAVDCAAISTVSVGSQGSGILQYEGTNDELDKSQELVLFSVDLGPLGPLEFGTVYAFLLGDFIDESALATLLASARQQLDPTSGYSLNQISIGFAAVFLGADVNGDIFDPSPPVAGLIITADEAVPEPGSLLLLGSGLVAVAAAARRRLRRRA